MVHYGIKCILKLCSIFIKSKIVLCSICFALNIALLADVAGGERTEELPLQSMATHGRSSSLPAMDVAGGERTGGAPPLAAMPRGARRDKEAGREGAERCSQRGSRRREGGAAPARSSATAGAVRRGDEIGQPDGVGVVVGVVLGKNGEMGTTVPRRGYIYPAHWSRFVSPTGTKG